MTFDEAIRQIVASRTSASSVSFAVEATPDYRRLQLAYEKAFEDCREKHLKKEAKPLDDFVFTV